jgi:hypothetical protein
VETFTVLAALRLDGPAGAGTTDGADDGDLLVWRDGADPRVLRLSTERSAEDLAAALGQGRALAAEALARVAVPGQVIEVVAMADEESMVWRAEP